MEPKEHRKVKIVYQKTVSINGIVEDDGSNLLRISTDSGKTWFQVNKSNILTISPIPQR